MAVPPLPLSPSLSLSLSLINLTVSILIPPDLYDLTLAALPVAQGQNKMKFEFEIRIIEYDPLYAAL